MMLLCAVEIHAQNMSGFGPFVKQKISKGVDVEEISISF